VKGYGVRERGSRFPVFTSERSRSPRARVAVSGSGGQRHRGVRHEGLLAYGRRVAVSTSEGLFSASEGRGVCESRCPQRSRTSRAKGRGLHELGVARGSTLVERGSFDGLVRLVHVPKVEETRTILDFLWYGRVTDQRRVESTFDVRRSIGQRRRFESPARCALFPYAIIKPRPAASRSNHLRLSMVE
jgi:hypothetical protein